jgi:hypothetical protein
MLKIHTHLTRSRWILGSTLLAAANVGGVCLYCMTNDLGRSMSRNAPGSSLVGVRQPVGEERVGGQTDRFDKQANMTLPDDARAAADMFCGPRCAQFVLAHFGQRQDLYDLIREIQERDWRRGASLASIDRALRRRGIHTAALLINDTAALRWGEPVIVHLKGTAADDIGHFVVQLPSRDDRDSRFWCGLAGEQAIAARKAADLRSGAVLLASAGEIKSPASAVVSGRGDVLASLAATSLSAAVLALYVGYCVYSISLKRTKKS